VARFLGHLFLPQPVITIERARKRDREMFAIFLSPDDNDGAGARIFHYGIKPSARFPSSSVADATGCPCNWKILHALMVRELLIYVGDGHKYTHTGFSLWVHLNIEERAQRRE
jgi:hypothetical protein